MFYLAAGIYTVGIIVNAQRNRRKTARPLPTLLVIHSAFVVILLGVLWVAPFIYSYMPDLICQTMLRGSQVSIFDVVCGLVILAMGFSELSLVYEEAQ